MKIYLEPNEIKNLETVAMCLRDRLLIRIVFRLGCRISEALGIQVDDVDFGQSTVTIQHLKARINLLCSKCGTRLGKSNVFCPGCASGVKQPVTRESDHRLQRVLAIDKGSLDLLKEFEKRGGPVFKNGKRLLFAINRHRAWEIIKECAERAGLPKLAIPKQVEFIM